MISYVQVISLKPFKLIMFIKLCVKRLFVLKSLGWQHIDRFKMIVFFSIEILTHAHVFIYFFSETSAYFVALKQKHYCCQLKIQWVINLALKKSRSWKVFMAKESSVHSVWTMYWIACHLCALAKTGEKCIQFACEVEVIHHTCDRKLGIFPDIS